VSVANELVMPYQELPVCVVCAGGVLCSKCQKKMDKGEIAQFDIDLTRELLELEKKLLS